MTDRRLEVLLSTARRTSSADLSEATLTARVGRRESWVVRPGQLWRAAGGGESLLVYIISVASAAVEVAPVSIGWETGSDGGVIVNAEMSAFEAPLLLWLGEREELRLAALDRLFDEGFDAGLVRWLADPVAGVPAGCSWAQNRPGPLDPVWDELHEVHAALATVKDAWPSASQESDDMVQRAIEALKPSEIAKRLDIPVADAVRVRRSPATLDATQIAALLDVDAPAKSVGASLDVAYRGAVEDPAIREDVVELSAFWQSDLSGTMDRVGSEAFALAARSAGAGVATPAQRVRAVIDRELARARSSD